MKINFSKSLIFLLVMVCPVFGQASESIYHDSDPILFEVIENGVISNKRVSLEVKAGGKNGTQWAQCLITVFHINNGKKSIELNMFYALTDNATIRDLSVSAEAISFEMIPFPLAPDRPLRFVASRQGEKSHLYQASATGLWRELINEKEMLKIEWRQVPSFTLPFSIIGK